MQLFPFIKIKQYKENDRTQIQSNGLTKPSPMENLIQHLPTDIYNTSRDKTREPEMFSWDLNFRSQLKIARKKSNRVKAQLLIYDRHVTTNNPTDCSERWRLYYKNFNITVNWTNSNGIKILDRSSYPPINMKKNAFRTREQLTKSISPRTQIDESNAKKSDPQSLEQNRSDPQKAFTPNTKMKPNLRGQNKLEKTTHWDPRWWPSGREGQCLCWKIWSLVLFVETHGPGEQCEIESRDSKCVCGCLSKFG